MHCFDCENWKASGDGNRRRCVATGEWRWKGDDAEECSELIVRMREGVLRC